MLITYEFVKGSEFADFFKRHRAIVFEEDFDFDIQQVLTDVEKTNRAEKIEKLKGAYRHFLVARCGGKFVGWSFGVQRAAEDLFMINSAVLPSYRRQGIYSQLLKTTIEKARAEGFQRIYSLHKMANNAILIPKLKFGFVITGFTVNDSFGTLVELSYYTNAERRKLLEVRMGTRKPDEDLLKLVV